MVVFAAAGDNDSSDGGPTPVNVDVPAACPHVVACGGTSRTATAESVWNNSPGNTNGEGTGGGYSKYFGVQSFQVGAPPPPAGLGRMVPDVSADADPDTGYNVYVHGEAVSGIGGTSAVAPLYAGLFAAFGTKLGFVSPKLWANQNCFNDITEGNNGFYSAALGPDPCTGIGSPIGTKIAALFP
jgi:kumamolisin